MSGFLAGKVWHSALPPTLKPLAAAMADEARDDGSECAPSLDLIVWKIGQSRRAVQIHMRELRQMRVLVAVCHPECQQAPGGGHGRGQPVRYDFDAEALPKRGSWAEERARLRAERDGKGEDFDASVVKGADEALKGDRSLPTTRIPTTRIPTATTALVEMIEHACGWSTLSASASEQIGVWASALEVEDVPKIQREFDDVRRRNQQRGNPWQLVKAIAGRVYTERRDGLDPWRPTSIAGMGRGGAQARGTDARQNRPARVGAGDPRGAGRGDGSRGQFSYAPPGADAADGRDAGGLAGTKPPRGVEGRDSGGGA